MAFKYDFTVFVKGVTGKKIICNVHHSLSWTDYVTNMVSDTMTQDFMFIIILLYSPPLKFYQRAGEDLFGIYLREQTQHRQKIQIMFNIECSSLSKGKLLFINRL